MTFPARTFLERKSTTSPWIILVKPQAPGEMNLPQEEDKEPAAGIWSEIIPWQLRQALFSVWQIIIIQLKEARQLLGLSFHKEAL